MMDAPFFIVGSARSGTTLLRLMLNAHPEIAVPPESRFIVELWEGRDEISASGFVERLASHGRFRTWDMPIEVVREELEGRARVTYRDAIAVTFETYARLQGKNRWGDKTPRYIEHIPFLARLFPDSRFIHLIRDGRNVALSYADVPFGPKTVAKAARLWAHRVSCGLRDGRALEAGRYIEIRYEDLVEDAAGEAKDICEFLDVTFDPGMLDHTQRTRDAVLPRASRYNPNVTEPPKPNVRSWKEAMPPFHVEVFESVAGGVLSELGYERTCPDPGSKARLAGRLGAAGLPVTRIRSTRS